MAIQLIEWPLNAKINTKYTITNPIDSDPTSPAKHFARLLKLKKLKTTMDSITYHIRLGGAKCTKYALTYNSAKDTTSE